MSRLALLVVVVWLALYSAAAAVITLSQDFDSGSLDVAVSTVSDSLVTLEPRRFPSSEWYGDQWWVAFSASGVSGQTPTFRIPTNQAFQGYSAASRWVYSADNGANWSFFNNGSVSGGYYQFSNNTPFAVDQVMVAAAIPYPVARTTAYTQSLAGNPYVAPVASDAAYGAPSDFVIGVSHTGTLIDPSDGGKGVVPQLPLHAYKITDSTVTGPKAKIVITSGNHSGESTGSWTQQGFVDFALSNDPAAVALRQKAEIYVYPQSNPDGRWAGYFRSNPENPTKNHNRFWHDTTGFTDLTTITAAMKSDTGGEVDFFFDFHSFGSPTDLGYYRRSDNPETTTFFNDLISREPTLRSLGSIGESGVAAVWAATPAGLSAQVSFTPEAGFLANQPVERYFTLGANYARAVLTAIENPPQPPAPRSETAFLQQVAALGPRMHLRLNETYTNPAGQPAVDATGGHHGTYYGSPTLAQSTPFAEGAGTAAKFSGAVASVKQYVRVPDFNYTNAQNELTVALWYKNNDISGNVIQYMFSHGTVSTANSLNVYFVEEGYSAVPNTLRTAFLDSTDANSYLDISTAAAPAVADDQWHLYTFVYSAADQAAIVYIDGVERARNTSVGGQSFNPATDLYIAGRQDLDPNRFYGRAGADDGLLDEILIFDKALTSSEIAGLAASPVPEPAAWLLLACGLAAWPMWRRGKCVA